MTVTQDDPDRLVGVLDAASRVDGPARLIEAKVAKAEPALLPHAKGSNAELLANALGHLLVETPRAPNQPRRVVLTPDGIRFLVKHRTPNEREAIARRAAPFYRERLLRTWRSLASPSELDLVRKAVEELYGDLLELRSGDRLSEVSQVRRDMARELVVSWSRATEAAARAGLARAMVALGLREVGSVGDRIRFSGRVHRAEESLFPGDPAVVVETGWSILDEAGELLLHKATVAPLDEP